MAIGEVLNLSEFLLSPETVVRINGLITILKAAGIVFIIYLVYLISRMIFGWKKNRRIKNMEKTLNSIEKKLDKVLKKKKS